MATGKYTAADLASDNPAPVGKYTAADLADAAVPPKAPVTAPIGTLSPSDKPTWLQNAESDVRLGGNRTLVGKTLGRLQGSDQGYSGIGGVAPKAAEMMASPVLGGIHALQGTIDDFGHPIKGNLKTLQGISEMATLPSMVAASPGASAAFDAIPSAKHAGSMFSDLATRAADAGTHIKMSAVDPHLERLLELADTGTNLPKAVTQLANEGTSLTYQKARDFASSISKLSAEEKMAIKPEAAAVLNRLKSALHSDIGSSLGPEDAGQYRDALKEYAQSARLGEGAKYVGKKLAQAAGAGAAVEGYHQLKRLF